MSSNSRKPLTPGYENEEGPHHEHDSEGNLIIDFTGGSDSSAEFAKESSTENINQRQIDPATGYAKDMIWTTKDGRRIPIPHMQDSHLLNTIAFLRRRVEPVYKRRAIALLSMKLFKATFMKQMFDYESWEEDEADYKIHELHETIRSEAERIYNLSDDHFLREFSPQFPNLYQEAYKRKLLIEVDPSKLEGAK